MMTGERGETHSRPSTPTPALFSISISSISTAGSTTTPPPISPTVFCAKIPRRHEVDLERPKLVDDRMPALFPPLKRAT